MTSSHVPGNKNQGMLVTNGSTGLAFFLYVFLPLSFSFVDVFLCQSFPFSFSLPSFTL